MIDLGFNSAYLAQYVMGNFESVSASFRDSVLGKPVEDCASCNVFFKNGAMGLIDATFDSPSMSVFELSVYGTLGAYHARFGGAEMAELHIEGQPREHLELSALPCDVEPPVTTWVKACLTGSSIGPYGIDNAVELVKFMNAAYQSHRENGLRKAI